MATYPTPEEAGRGILSVFEKFHARTGNGMFLVQQNTTFLVMGFQPADFQLGTLAYAGGSYGDSARQT